MHFSYSRRAQLSLSSLSSGAGQVSAGGQVRGVSDTLLCVFDLRNLCCDPSVVNYCEKSLIMTLLKCFKG